jgi:hypothetical protein
VPVALVTTEGCRDALTIARQNRRDLYRLDIPPELPPLVPEGLRFEACERSGARYSVPLPFRWPLRRRATPAALGCFMTPTLAQCDEQTGHEAGRQTGATRRIPTSAKGPDLFALQSRPGSDRRR